MTFCRIVKPESHILYNYTFYWFTDIYWCWRRLFFHRVTEDIGDLLVLLVLLHMESREAPPPFISLDRRYCSENNSWVNQFVCFNAKTSMCVFFDVCLWLQGDRGLPGDKGDKVSNYETLSRFSLLKCMICVFNNDFSSQGYCLPYQNGIKGEPGPPGPRVSVT